MCITRRGGWTWIDGRARFADKVVHDTIFLKSELDGVESVNRLKLVPTKKYSASLAIEHDVDNNIVGKTKAFELSDIGGIDVESIDKIFGTDAIGED